MNKNKFYKCCKCGEVSDGSICGKIDEKIYCESCWNDAMDKMENETIHIQLGVPQYEPPVDDCGEE